MGFAATLRHQPAPPTRYLYLIMKKAFCIVWLLCGLTALAATGQLLRIETFSVAGLGPARIDHLSRSIYISLPDGFSATTFTPLFTTSPDVRQATPASGQLLDFSDKKIIIQLVGEGRGSYQLFVQSNDFSDWKSPGTINLIRSRPGQVVALPVRRRGTRLTGRPEGPATLTLTPAGGGSRIRVPLLDPADEEGFRFAWPCQLPTGEYTATVQLDGQEVALGKRLVVKPGDPALLGSDWLPDAPADCRFSARVKAGQAWRLRGLNFADNKKYQVRIMSDFYEREVPATVVNENELLVALPADLPTGVHAFGVMEAGKALASPENRLLLLADAALGPDLLTDEIRLSAQTEVLTFTPGQVLLFSTLKSRTAGGVLALVHNGQTYLTEGSEIRRLSELAYFTATRLPASIPAGTYEVFLQKNGQPQGRYVRKIVVR